MARLHRYVSSAEKSGYYLRGRSPESNTTFQVGRVATLLIDWLGIPLGERVPDDLLWKMYDTGLIWTESQGCNAPTDLDLAAFLKNASGREDLSDAQALKLCQFVTDYEGQNTAAVKQLSSLVPGLEYEAPDEPIQRFAEQNELSKIADKYFSRGTIDPATADTLIKHEVPESDRQLLTGFPASVTDSLSAFASGYFELAALSIGRYGITYTFMDPEMWIGEGMVWTEWRLFDNRMNAQMQVDFEVEFEIETDAHLVDPPIITYANITDGVLADLELIDDFDNDDPQYLSGSALSKPPYKAFRDYVHDCLARQFETVDAYRYDGPDTVFSR